MAQDEEIAINISYHTFHTFQEQILRVNDNLLLEDSP